MSRDRVLLNASLAFAGLTAIFLVGANLIGDTYRMSSVLVIISGMTTMGSFTSFQRFIEGRNSNAPDMPVTFNEEFLSTSITHAFESFTEDRGLYERRELPPWDLASDQLIGKDNALALAKLRIDLESDLRRIAFMGKGLPERQVSAMEIARKLIDGGNLPAEMLEPLRGVMAVCNRGIHGEEIPDALALSVARIGHQLREQFRLNPSYGPELPRLT